MVYSASVIISPNLVAVGNQLLDTEHHEATFCLGGQSYRFEPEVIREGGPELAAMALYETYRHVWRLWSEMHCGRLCREEWEQTHIELLSGIVQLNDLVPVGVELPNSHFVLN